MTITPRLNSLETKMDLVLKKLDQLLYEEEVIPPQPKPQPQQNPDPFMNPEIYTRGQRVPYSKIVGDQVEDFRKFLYEIRMNSSNYSEREVDYASFSDKNFSDIRLSDNSKRILEGAYFRTYNRNWPFTFIKGYLHKLGDDKGWSWEDGSWD